jgi:hypothetical protein
MAEASFIIRAVDATRQAFGNIQNSLAQLKQSSSAAAAFMKRAFDPKALGFGLASALGVSLTAAIDKAVDAIGKLITRFEDVKKIVKETAEEVKKIYGTAAFEALTQEGQLKSAMQKRIEMEREIESLRKKTAVVTKETMTMDRTGRVRTVTTFDSAATVEEANRLKELDVEYAKLNVQISKLDSQITGARFDKRADDFGKAVGKVTDEFEQLIDAVRRTNDESEQARISADQMMVGLAEREKDMLDPMREYARQIDLVIGLKHKQLLTSEEAERRIKQIVEASGESGRKAMEDYTASFEDFERMRALVSGRQASDGEQLNALKARETELVAKLAATGAGDLENRTKLQKELVAVYKDMLPLLEEQRRLGNEAGAMIAMGFEDAIFAGEKLSDVLKNLALDLMRLIFRNVITAPLASSIGNFINAGLGFLAKGGPAKAGSPYVVGEQGPELFVPGISGTVVPNSKIARIMASMSGSLGFLAKGGPAKAGSPYIVGEQGPELFVPGSSGTVIPNDRMGQMGSAVGGPNINISYNIQSGVSRAELQPILEQERKRLMVTIPDLVRRGGSYRNAFA